MVSNAKMAEENCSQNVTVVGNSSNVAVSQPVRPKIVKTKSITRL